MGRTVLVFPLSATRRRDLLIEGSEGFDYRL
jgi:hypothetical protein